MNKLVYNYYKSHPWMEKLNKETFVGKIFSFVRMVCDFFKYKFRAIKEYIISLPRAMGLIDKNFTPLLELKGKYKGKRCFIVCTGPSLTIDDLEMLKGEFVFGMNSTAMILDKTTWRPDFFGIQDAAVYEKIREVVDNAGNGKIFVPDSFKKHYEYHPEWIYFPTCSAYNLFECYWLKKYFAWFSKNCYARVYTGFSISYSLVQLAFYLGFQEIYLLGADCSYSVGGKNHFAEHGHNPGNFDISTQRLLTVYGYLRKYADKYGLKIYNATRGGKLEAFERVNLEDVISNKVNNKC